VFLEETFTVPKSQRKDQVAALAKSNLIYGFTCTCGSMYAGRTARQLESRINEHVPKWLYSNRRGIPHSSITKHLHETGHRVNVDEAFQIIYKPKNVHTLRFAEAVTIRLKNPVLCVQKQMVTNLSLPW
jgi:hypothetical protein